MINKLQLNLFFYFKNLKNKMIIFISMIKKMFKFKKKSKYYINIKNSLLTFKNPKNKKKIYSLFQIIKLYIFKSFNST